MGPVLSRLAAAAAVIAWALSTGAAAHGAPTVRLFAGPTPVPGTDGRQHLAYEIVVENGPRQSARLEKLEVRDAGRRTILASYRRRALANLVARLDGRTGTRTLPKRVTGVLLLDVSVAAGQPVPVRLAHRLTLSLRGGAGRTRRLTIGAAVGVAQQEPLPLGPPLRGGNLAVQGCCSRPFAHRLAIGERDDRPVFAQRYAIDFRRLDDQIGSFAGEPTRNESYFVYGAEVIAAESGRIVATRGYVPENTPPGAPSGVGPDDLVGNFVNQDLGGDQFALYAHLQPGSLRVQPGAEVVRGQVLGLVGNTGNSTEPHLHFQVMDGRGGTSNLAADGLPFVFDAFRLESRVSGLAADPPARARMPAALPAERTGQYPFTGDVVAFP